jgi:hypothetical protein
VVRHRGALGRARLRGADVHPAVDQRRIDADDLHREAVARKRLRQRERGAALAARGRADQPDPVRPRAHRRAAAMHGGERRRERVVAATARAAAADRSTGQQEGPGDGQCIAKG